MRLPFAGSEYGQDLLFLLYSAHVGFICMMVPTDFENTNPAPENQHSTVFTRIMPNICPVFRR